MRVETIPIDIPNPGGEGRTPGVHVSGLLRMMAVEYGLLDEKYVEDLSLVEVPGRSDDWWAKLDQKSKLRISMGLAWEQYYLPRLGYVVHQPGELCCQGIYMSRDGEALDVLYSENGLTKRHVLALHEVKVTYKSINNYLPLEDQWLLMMQLKSYLKGMSERAKMLVNVSYLHTLFVCGDYSYPISPRLGPVEEFAHCWRIVFEEQEIEDAWSLTTDTLRRYRLEGRT